MERQNKSLSTTVTLPCRGGSKYRTINYKGLIAQQRVGGMENGKKNKIEVSQATSSRTLAY